MPVSVARAVLCLRHTHTQKFHLNLEAQLECHILHNSCNVSFGVIPPPPFLNPYSYASQDEGWHHHRSLREVLKNAVSHHSLFLCNPRNCGSLLMFENLFRPYHWKARFGSSYPLILTQVSSVYSILCNLQPVLKALKTWSQICRTSLT